MRTIGVIHQGTPDDRGDLWPRLQARMREEEAPIRIPAPRIGWREATALVVVIGALAGVSDPLGFLAAAGLL